MADFRVYLAAAQSVLDGDSLYRSGYRYPPTLALLLTPMTLLPPLTAQRVWTLIDQGFLATAIGLSLRWLPRRLSRVEIALLLAITCGFFPLYNQLKVGQMGNIIFLLIALMVTAWHGGARLHAGWPIALAGALKLYPIGLALWFVRQHAWGTVLLIGVAGAGILFLPDAIFRGAWMDDYVRSLPEMFASGASPIKADNQSFFAFMARLGASTQWNSVGFAIAATAALMALILTLACTPVGATRGDVTAIAVTATFLPLAWANPVSWTHNYVALLVAAPALVQRLAGRLSGARHRNDLVATAAAVISWVFMSQPFRLPRLFGYGDSSTDPVAMLLRSTFLCGTIIIWIVLLREMRLARQELRP